ncbi:hypothetical protein I4F81_005719 [Pyropia yezoensis]|uniref:Uncharacterized protein n=1 Tax=Pyropia yezoensis TaxID=2788 RepID=A0ACC3C025_PYRYE|nr:hypothetical protein I4F81_005719 [Neopyropia yezoensis]
MHGDLGGASGGGCWRGAGTESWLGRVWCNTQAALVVFYRERARRRVARPARTRRAAGFPHLSRLRSRRRQKSTICGHADGDGGARSSPVMQVGMRFRSTLGKERSPAGAVKRQVSQRPRRLPWWTVPGKEPPKFRRNELFKIPE